MLNIPWIAVAIPRCKFLHYPIDFLRLARESEFVENSSKCLHYSRTRKIEHVHICVHNFFIEAKIADLIQCERKINNYELTCFHLRGSPQRRFCRFSPLHRRTWQSQPGLYPRSLFLGEKRGLVSVFVQI